MNLHDGCEYDSITASMSLLQFCFLPFLFIWIFWRISCSHKWHEKDTNYVLFDGNRTGRYGVLVEIHRSGDARYVCRGSSRRVNEYFPRYICGRLEFFSSVVRKYPRVDQVLSFTRQESVHRRYLPSVHPLFHAIQTIYQQINRLNKVLTAKHYAIEIKKCLCS